MYIDLKTAANLSFYFAKRHLHAIFNFPKYNTTSQLPFPPTTSGLEVMIPHLLSELRFPIA